MKKLRRKLKDSVLIATALIVLIVAGKWMFEEED
jgi:hypothetical protein